MKISKKSIDVLNSVTVELFDLFLREARNLQLYSGRQTMGHRELECAAKLLLEGELRDSAVRESNNAIQTFTKDNKLWDLFLWNNFRLYFSIANFKN